MIKMFFFSVFLFCQHTIFSQSFISGKVTDAAGMAVGGANVYLEGTYDGASTAEDGSFTFETSEAGIQMLVVSMISYETYRITAEEDSFSDLQIVLREAVNQLSGVTLTAGTFEAGDNTKVAVLKPLDIVTTAGAAGDFVAALQTLPGTSTVNEDGRLFVRGGGAEETQVFIDGMRVFQPFNATANNIPTRGRFSPFLFKGITFSTGGYSAEYGQALSSVLLLNTTDLPDQEQSDISLMSVGGGLGHTEIWGGESLSLNTSYINLAPYQRLVPNDQGTAWNRPYESISGEAVFRSKGENSIFKLYGGFNHANLDLAQEDINAPNLVDFRLKNNNLYANASYRYFLKDHWTLGLGGSLSSDRNRIGIGRDSINTRETATHLKVKLGKQFNNRFRWELGAEHFLIDYRDDYRAISGLSVKGEAIDQISAAFTEADLFFGDRLAVKIGVRAERSTLLREANLAPRLSLAYKSSDKGQFSLAFGTFYQNPLNDYVKYDPDLKMEKTTHFILNYQHTDDGTTFRAEAYFKDYGNLVKYDTEVPRFDSNFNNLGYGTAKGIDIFWRDNKNIKNLDYWVSYSFLDTERDFRNFRNRATPQFAAGHNFSLVTKYWINDWRSQVGFSYNFASGRPY
ncbi:MAG: TonB-dependent receptor, partial [Flavobacteriaceae bacterium]